MKIAVQFYKQRFSRKFQNWKRLNEKDHSEYKS